MWNVGDVVELKSGGPEMTVETVGKDAGGKDMIWCAWFNGTDKKSGCFPPEAVKKPGVISFG